MAVRLAVEANGCSGFGYRVDPAEAVRDDDKVFESEGVRIVVDAASLPYLQGTTLDVVEEGLVRRVRFDNPNAPELRLRRELRCMSNPACKAPTEVIAVVHAVSRRCAQPQRIGDHGAELKLIANAAISGDSSRPKNGYNTPAAIGTPSAL